MLLDTLYNYQKHTAFSNERFGKLFFVLNGSLEDVLVMIEGRIADFFSAERCLPAVFLKKDKSKLNKLKKKLREEWMDPALTVIVLRQLDLFLSTNLQRKRFGNELLYWNELLMQLEQVGTIKSQSSFFDSLNEMLLYMNFNCRIYANYLSRKMAEKINELEHNSERIERLYLFLKELNQLPFQQEFCLEQERQQLRIFLSNWVEQEILYLEKSNAVMSGVKSVKKERTKSEIIPSGIKVNLSVDQLALILRAIDSTRIIESRSLSFVFRTIVPHLSTPHKTELSFESMRSKSYGAEARDKEIAIVVLERLIKHIREF